MERTGDGQPTWGMWKTAVLGLPAEPLHRYLADAEKFSPEKIATFLSDSSAIRPEDSESSSDAADALNRFFAWKKETMDPGEDLEYQKIRSAAMPGTEPKR